MGIKDKQDGEYYSIEPVKVTSSETGIRNGKEREAEERNGYFMGEREGEEILGPRAVRRKIEKNFHLGSVGRLDRGRIAVKWRGKGVERVGGRAWALRSSW